MSDFDAFEEVFRREQLHFAAQDGDTEKVSELLADGYEADLFDDIGKTPLHYAAAHGHLDVMRLLLASGAHVDAHDERCIGNTPLGDVAASCSLEVAKI